MNEDPRQHIPAFVRKQKLERPATHEITFRVRGKFPFPLAMLQLDACHPASEQDVEEIVRSVKHPGNDEFQVTLRRIADESWEPAQLWHAHGYQVAEDPERAGSSTAAPPPAAPAPAAPAKPASSGKAGKPDSEST